MFKLENPYFNQLPINLPLQSELCQEIHWTALRAAAQGLYPEAKPAYLDLERIENTRKLIGTDAYLFHPDYIADVFIGVTLAHYQVAETLYCSRLERSITIVHLILTKMAEEAGELPLTYEAVWAICLYLEERRQKSSAVKITKVDSVWQLIVLKAKVMLEHEDNTVFSPKIVCVIETGVPKVLAYRITDDDISNATRLVLYDALISVRRPAVLTPAGLEWIIPTEFYSEISLNEQVNDVMQQHFQVYVQQGVIPSNLIDALKGNWTENLANRVTQPTQFDRIFDNYLHRIHGFGPKRVQADLSDEYASLVGYNLDPGSIFPELRLLLPEHDASISSTGEVIFDDLHYTDPLLKYWREYQVTLRRSEQTESTAWIYLDGDILCEAKARELRKSDGTYRKHRIHRMR